MKIAYITPGFGGKFYCQNCMYGLDLAGALDKKGYEAILTSMYMPLRGDMPVPEGSPIFYGAINVYLKEKFSLLRYMPAWMEKLFNSGILMKWVSQKSGMTDPVGLAQMTISVMRGEDGGQFKELDKLIMWLKDEVAPDIVHLSNALLIGIAVKIKKELDIPVFCNLFDENSWLDRMGEPYSAEGWNLILKGAGVIDGFIAASSYYKDMILDRIDIPRNMINVVPAGIDIVKYRYREPSCDPPVIGFLSRMSKDSGLDILVEAFIKLKQDKRHSKLKLKLSGGIGYNDKKFIDRNRKKLSASGLQGEVIVEPYSYLTDIAGFFDSLTLLCVPKLEGESFGSFLLESMCSGIPVVEPETGAYPEIIRNTSGGVTYSPNTSEKLAEVLSRLLLSPERISTMSRQGSQSVLKDYSIENTVDALLKIYTAR